MSSHDAPKDLLLMTGNLWSNNVEDYTSSWPDKVKAVQLYLNGEISKLFVKIIFQ